MAFRFRRRIRILPGLTVNVGKRGLSTSIGVRGARVTLGGAGGTRTTVGLPGTGLSYTSQRAAGASPAASPADAPAGGVRRGPTFWRALGIVFAFYYAARVLAWYLAR